MKTMNFIEKVRHHRFVEDRVIRRKFGQFRNAIVYWRMVRELAVELRDRHRGGTDQLHRQEMSNIESVLHTYVVAVSNLALLLHLPRNERTWRAYHEILRPYHEAREERHAFFLHSFNLINSD